MPAVRRDLLGSLVNDLSSLSLVRKTVKFALPLDEQPVSSTSTTLVSATMRSGVACRMASLTMEAKSPGNERPVASYTGMEMRASYCGVEVTSGVRVDVDKKAGPSTSAATDRVLRAARAKVELWKLRNQQESVFAEVRALRERHARARASLRWCTRVSKRRRNLYSQYTTGTLKHVRDAERRREMLLSGMQKTLSTAESLVSLRRELAERIRERELCLAFYRRRIRNGEALLANEELERRITSC